jgi:hypothetical protein
LKGSIYSSNVVEDEVQASEDVEGNEDNAALVDSSGSAMFDKRATLALIENGTEKV